MGAFRSECRDEARELTLPTALAPLELQWLRKGAFLSDASVGRPLTVQFRRLLEPHAPRDQNMRAVRIGDLGTREVETALER